MRPDFSLLGRDFIAFDAQRRKDLCYRANPRTIIIYIIQFVRAPATLPTALERVAPSRGETIDLRRSIGTHRAREADMTDDADEDLFDRIRDQLFTAVVGDVMDAAGLTR